MLSKDIAICWQVWHKEGVLELAFLTTHVEHEEDIQRGAKTKEPNICSTKESDMMSR